MDEIMIPADAVGDLMTLEARIVDALRKDDLWLACAESCTGGLFGARITRVPGASDVFRGGIVAYKDDVKTQLLAVDRGLVAKAGPVSREVAAAMAVGVRELLGADLAVAITGYAGPAVPPGADLGRVYIALAHWGGVEVHDLHFPAEREKVREGAVEEALGFVLAAIPKVTRARA